MSASYLVDANATTINGTSIGTAFAGAVPASGVIVGQGLDFTLAGTYCNLWVAAGPSLSGIARVAVQTAPTNTSGLYTDPTSGLATFPSQFQSGGILIINSGASLSGSTFLSGGSMEFSAFLRPASAVWVRAMVLSGDQHNAPLMAGFVEQASITGSGTGTTYLPSSGILQV